MWSAFSRLDELPPEAAADVTFFRRIGTKSNLAMPMAVGGRVVGAIAIACFKHERAWSEDLVARLRVLADVFANALAHKRAQEQFEEGKARLDAIVRSAMDAIITVDGNQRVVLFNAAAEKMFACSASRAIGVPLDRFIPERFRAMHRAHIERFTRTGETSRRMGMQTALWALRSDGTEFPIEASISHATIAGQQLLTVILRDITERVSAAREIDQALRFEQLLTDLSAGLLRAPSLDLGRVVPDALRAIGEFLRADRVVLWRLSRAEDRLVADALVGGCAGAASRLRSCRERTCRGSASACCAARSSNSRASMIGRPKPARSGACRNDSVCARCCRCPCASTAASPRCCRSRS